MTEATARPSPLLVATLIAAIAGLGVATYGALRAAVDNAVKVLCPPAPEPDDSARPTRRAPASPR